MSFVNMPEPHRLFINGEEVSFDRMFVERDFRTQTLMVFVETSQAGLYKLDMPAPSIDKAMYDMVKGAQA